MLLLLLLLSNKYIDNPNVVFSFQGVSRRFIAAKHLHRMLYGCDGVLGKDCQIPKDREPMDDGIKGRESGKSLVEGVQIIEGMLYSSICDVFVVCCANLIRVVYMYLFDFNRRLR